MIHYFIVRYIKVSRVLNVLQLSYTFFDAQKLTESNFISDFK